MDKGTFASYKFKASDAIEGLNRYFAETKAFRYRRVPLEIRNGEVKPGNYYVIRNIVFDVSVPKIKECGYGYVICDPEEVVGAAINWLREEHDIFYTPGMRVPVEDFDVDEAAREYEKETRKDRVDELRGSWSDIIAALQKRLSDAKRRIVALEEGHAEKSKIIDRQVALIKDLEEQLHEAEEREDQDMLESYIRTGDGKDYVDVDCVREALGIKEDEDIFLAIKRERDLYRTEIDNLKDNIRIKNNALKTVKKERDELKEKCDKLKLRANAMHGASCGYSASKEPTFRCDVISYSWNFGPIAPCSLMDEPSYRVHNNSIRVELDLTPTASYKGTFDMADLKRYIQEYGREKKLGIVESIDYQNAKTARAELAYLYEVVFGEGRPDTNLSPHEVMKAILDEYERVRDARCEFLRELSYSLGFGDPVVKPDNIDQKEKDILERVEKLKGGVWPYLWGFRRNAIEDLKSRGFCFRPEENETLPEIYDKLLKRYDWAYGVYKEQFLLRQTWHARYESEHERANGVQKALDREREKCRVKDISLETAKKQYEKVCNNLETAECAINGMKSKVLSLREEKTKVITALGQDVWDDCLK